MGLIELILLSVGLAMDAFAVSIGNGLSMKKSSPKAALAIAFSFGLFQALMPTAGYFLGSAFESVISEFDHYIALIFLGFIGGKMIFDALREKGESEEDDGCLNLKELFVLAVATSIDALAVGVTFAFIGTDIAPAVGIIGVTTFLLSLAGVFIGHRFGLRFKSKAELAGGAVLVLIGLKILLEHLGVI